MKTIEDYLIIISTFFVFISSGNSQITSSFNNTQIVITPKTILNPFNSTGQISYASFSSKYIFTISSTNTIEIANKYTPSIKYGNISFSADQILKDIIFDQKYKKMVIISKNIGTDFFFYSFSNSGSSGNSYSAPTYDYTFYAFYLSMALNSFIANQKIYSLVNSLPYDYINTFEMSNSNINAINLSITNSSMSVSPDRKYALLCTQQSQLYIYSVSTGFSLLYVYNDSIVNATGATQKISFSSDSKFAILETDSYHPIRIINLKNFTIKQNITIDDRIISADFIDEDSQYVLINCQSTIIYCYDTVTNTLSQFDGNLTADELLVDIDSRKILIRQNGSFGNLLKFKIMQDYNGVPPSNTTNLTSGNVNSTIIDTNINNSQFFYSIILNPQQNRTYKIMTKISSAMSTIVINFNSIVFSSPFTCLFLGFLNYFTLNSLYVLLNIQLPQILFAQLSSFYLSANSNLLTFFNVEVDVPPLTDELTNQSRALYFGISSDLISSNYYTFGLILSNIIIVEIILLGMKLTSKKSFIYSLICMNRRNIYFGLFVSSIVGLILPWKFVMQGQILSLSTKLNVIIQNLMYCFIGQILSISFISTLKKKYENLEIDQNESKTVEQTTIRSKQRKKNMKIQYIIKLQQYNHQNDFIKIKQIPEWMIAFQNFLYPLLVLLSECHYFLIIVFLSKLTETILFIKHTEKIRLSKYLQVASFACEILFNCTFFIFAATKDNEIITINCFACLTFFFLGAIINVLLVLIYVAIVIKAIIVFIVGSSKVTPLKKKQQNENNCKIKSQTNFETIVKPSYILTIKNIEIQQTHQKSQEKTFAINIGSRKIFKSFRTRKQF